MAITTGTVTETQFTEAFKKFIEGEQNADVKALRQEAFAYFAEAGLPTPKNEDWKYTNVAPIAKEAWATPDFRPDFSSAADEKSGPVIGAFNYRRNGFTALNQAFGEYHVIRIPRNTQLEEPITIGFGGQDGSVIFPHVIIIAEVGSKATI